MYRGAFQKFLLTGIICITTEIPPKLDRICPGDTFVHEADSIWARTTALEPLLDVPETEILVSFAGLRPGRLEGARIKKEAWSDGRIFVHNYAAGGMGYQAGLGMAMEAVELALPFLGDSIGSLNKFEKTKL